MRRKSELRSRSKPAKRFLDVGCLDAVTPVVDSLPHVGESGPARRFSHGRLLLKCGYGVEATGAYENRSAQKAAAGVESPVPFRDAFAADAGVRLFPVVRYARLGRRLGQRHTLLRDPGSKNSDDPIPSHGEER